MKIKVKFTLILVFILGFKTLAQDVFPSAGKLFNDEVVPRIDITIDEDSLDMLLDDENLDSSHEYPAIFYWFDGLHRDTIKNVGFRLRGNTSRLAQKKSFKIKFDAFEDIDYEGVVEMNLNGEHNDPSISRAKIAWDLMRLADIEAPRANHVQLYINGVYRGLYLNVEHIDNIFLKVRNKSTTGQLFKCLYGSDFIYKGSDPDKYKDNVYEPANNKERVKKEGLIEFTQMLGNLNENNRCAFESIFDVERYIKIMALEILIGHWDNPIYNINNAYAYFNDVSGQLEIISYDTDNTFGIDWFGVDWKTRNIYSWSKENASRPIYTRILNVPEYKKMFAFYIDKYIRDFYNSNYMNPYLDKLKTKISPYVINDSYARLDYGYTYSDFEQSFQQAAGQHVKSGIKEFINQRVSSALAQLQNKDVAPFPTQVYSEKSGNKMLLKFLMSGRPTSELIMVYTIDNESMVQKNLKDDGNAPDEHPDDGIFTIELNIEGGKVLHYHLQIKDNSGTEIRYPLCEDEKVLLSYDSDVPMFINEFMADNSMLDDGYGEFEDWIELYNDSEEDVYLKEFYLSDDPTNPTKWALPDFVVPGKSFVLIWADEDKSQGPDHSNFKLNKQGEFIGLYESANNGYAVIDSMYFGPVLKDKSYGRWPDGMGPLIALNDVTPGFSNVVVGAEDVENKVNIYPNPFSEWVTIKHNDTNTTVSVKDAHGKLIFSKNKFSPELSICMASLPIGSYFLTISGRKGSSSTLLIKI